MLLKMKKDICSIPISDVFEPKSGCPICRLHNMLEQRMIEYTLGASLMEPDVRIETNRLGFCSHHFEKLLGQRNRLGLALILESHLEGVQKSAFSSAFSKSKPIDSCFICDNILVYIDRMLDTLYILYNKENDFRRLFEEQQCLCLPHYHLLMKKAKADIDKKLQSKFANECERLSSGYLKELIGDVHHFCSMFDYRNNSEDADWGNSKDAIERAVWYLTSRDGE